MCIKFNKQEKIFKIQEKIAKNLFIFHFKKGFV